MAYMANEDDDGICEVDGALFEMGTKSQTVCLQIAAEYLADAVGISRSGERACQDLLEAEFVLVKCRRYVHQARLLKQAG